MNKKLIWGIIAVVIVILVVGVLKVSKVSVINWVTYTDSKNGFEISYPDNWKVDQNTGGLDDSVSIYKPNGVTGDNDTLQEYLHITYSTNCTNSEWEKSFSEIFEKIEKYEKSVCIDKNKGIIVNMFALSEDGKKIEEKILSTFKFTNNPN